MHDIVKQYNAVIKIRGIRNGESGAKDLIDIFTPGSNMDHVIDYMIASGASLPGGIVDKGLERASAVVDAESCDFCSEIVNLDAFLMESHLNMDGEIYLTLLYHMSQYLQTL